MAEVVGSLIYSRLYHNAFKFDLGSSNVILRGDDIRVFFSSALKFRFREVNSIRSAQI